MKVRLGEHMRINYDSPQVKWGITAFLVLAAAILFYFTVDKFPAISKEIHHFISILKPFIYGLVLAYLLCPIYNFFTIRIYGGTKKIMAEKRAITASRALSTTFTMIIAFVIMGGLFSLVLPQLIESIINLAKNAPKSATVLIEFITNKVSSNSELNSALNMFLGDYSQKLNNWVQSDLLPWLLKLAANLSNQVFDILNAIKDFGIGIIICIYFLNSKDIFKAQSKKFAFAVLSKRDASILIKEMAFINKTFSSFISGKIIDSLIIGIICFTVMSLLDMPYVVLVSVIVGVTNIIPFFGPFIGAIPSTIIILTVNPVTALYFVIFILILQQVDGNIIGPKILGDSTGLTSFWVMFAIIVAGGMFGFLGMILGIPIFAIIYVYVTRFVNHSLRRKSLPIETDVYKEVSSVIPKKHRIVRK